LKTFIINRENWLFGEGADNGRFYRNDDGKSCVLGQIARQHGYSNEELSNRSSIRGLIASGAKNKNNFFETFFYDLRRDNITTSMLAVNDNEYLTYCQREEKLINFAKELDIELKFVGEYECDL
jgi:hypothetical protein